MSHLALSSRLPGFSKLSREERLDQLVKDGFINDVDRQHLLSAVEPSLIEINESFIENVIGCYAMPLGIASNFRIDGRDRLIPMVVEETSIVAALCKTAKWVRSQGEVTTEVLGEQVIGQIQFAQPNNLVNLRGALAAHKDAWITAANQAVVPGLVRRGGGVTEIHWREVAGPDSQNMVVWHVLMDARDAMGANLINQVCEFLKPQIEQVSGETITMCIVSNLVDSRCIAATIRLRDIDTEVAQRIQAASIFAEQDPYRAATNNKGVMNGIDAVLIATGNDWRAVEAGVHAYAARDGQYRSITQWRFEGDELVGRFKAPLVVGTVGGVTRVHPTAKLCLRLVGVDSANDLACVAAAVGLMQNLAAVRALVTDGIVQGHMLLHISNLIADVGASATESVALRQQLEAKLADTQKVTMTDARELLAQLRQAQVHV